MNWDAISATAEAVGAAGVIITLIYLAVQVRQNTAQMSESAKDARLTAFEHAVEAFARHREYLTREGNGDLYAKGLGSYATLSDGEKFTFRAIIEEYFYAFHALFGRVREGNYDESLWQAQVESPASLLRMKGGREWWVESRYRFDTEFAAVLERLADSTD